MVTKKELDMLRFYGGDIRKRTEEGKLLIINSSENSKDPKDLLWRDKDAYRTLNALLFDGYENEKERIFQEHHQLNPIFIELLEETLAIYTGIFAVMCQNKEKQSVISTVRRVDRKASLSAYTKGYTESFVSCSRGGFESDFSKKNQIILLEIETSENSLYVDYQQALGAEYAKWDEQEVLFPPFLPLTMEEMELSKREKLSIHDMHGNSPCGKYLLKLREFPDYRKIITCSQEKLLEKMFSGKKEAATCLQKMNSGQWDEDFQEYINWKKNLHDYLKLLYSAMWCGTEEQK